MKKLLSEKKKFSIGIYTGDKNTQSKLGKNFYAVSKPLAISRRFRFSRHNKISVKRYFYTQTITIVCIFLRPKNKSATVNTIRN